MSQYFLAKVLEGVSFDYDIVATWLPLLKNVNNRKPDNHDPVKKFGATALAVLGQAAVEQYAKKKKLKDGTAQEFRLRSFNVSQAALTRSIHENAQLTILEMLATQKPELAPWVANVIKEIRDACDQNWYQVCAATAQILYDIQAQQFRKDRKGRVDLFGGKGRKPAHHLRDKIDADLLQDARNALPITRRNDIDAIRQNVRAFIKDWMIRGILPTGNQSQAETLDKHAKRIYRKIPILVRISQK